MVALLGILELIVQVVIYILIEGGKDKGWEEKKELEERGVHASDGVLDYSRNGW